MSVLFFSFGVIVGFLGFGFMINLPDVETMELNIRLDEVRDLALRIVKSSNKPACFKEPACPLNGGKGFDNHCNMKCPFFIANKIIKVIDGKKND